MILLLDYDSVHDLLHHLSHRTDPEIQYQLAGLWSLQSHQQQLVNDLQQIRDIDTIIWPMIVVNNLDQMLVWLNLGSQPWPGRPMISQLLHELMGYYSDVGQAAIDYMKLDVQRLCCYMI
mgnify:CR=1 FL=1